MTVTISERKTNMGRKYLWLMNGRPIFFWPSMWKRSHVAKILWLKRREEYEEKHSLEEVEELCYV
jgi:hypothetical protein